MKRILAFVALWSVLPLAGCAGGNDALVEPCCYQGEVTLTRLSALEFRLRDGTVLPFERVFPGYRPEEGWFALRLPFDEPIGMPRVTFAPLEKVLPAYDFNHDSVLEDPELLAFYVTEAARGLGHDVVQVMVQGRPVGALQSSNADIGGLVRYVGPNQARLGPDARAMFRVLAQESDFQHRDEQDGERDAWP